jgi:hypothetical protein
MIQSNYRYHLNIRVRALIVIQRAAKAFLRLKRGNQVMMQEDEPKRGVNLRLQEELFNAADKEKEKRKSTANRMSVKQQPVVKISDQLNNVDLNNEEDKSKMIEQLMEISIMTKHTKGILIFNFLDMNESNMYSVNKTGVILKNNLGGFRERVNFLQETEEENAWRKKSRGQVN